MAVVAHVNELKRAAEAIKRCKALIVTAGAGMGVDSGLPDFRGNEGFWKAYPPLKKLGVSLSGMSTPSWFETDPTFAWGFFGHRSNLYTTTQPHEGFKILLKWAKEKEIGYFAFTSNVDGHFQKAGFDDDKVVECHGSINFMQLTSTAISTKIWPVPEGIHYNVDMDTLHLKDDLPQGPPESPRILARPNILMFNDWGWQSERTDEQYRHFNKFRRSLRSISHADKDQIADVVIVEIGAGLAVPTIRWTSEELASDGCYNGVLIRINTNDEQVPDSDKNISLKMGGLEALREVDKLLKDY